MRLGADDYLTKPFSINEFMHVYIRLFAVIPLKSGISRRNRPHHCLKDMTIDKANRRFWYIKLLWSSPGKEFDLLVFLASNKGRIFTKKQIYTQVWEDEYAFDDSNIMSFISKLRKKIEPNPEHPFYVLTVRGVGYRFNKEA